MARNENDNKRKVTRQSWKPTGILAVLRAAWIASYSVIKILFGAVITVMIIGAVCLVAFLGTLGDYLQDDIIPNSNVSLEGFDLNQNSMMYFLNDNGEVEVLQKLHAQSNSQRATYEEIPQAMIHAAVAIEDKRFFEHQGVDWFTTIKACINMFIGSGDQFGGSSITQQLVKNLYLRDDETADDVTVQRKVQEIFRAIELEKRYDKNTIITWYLNEIYLGNRIDGVKAAAEYYFGKELELLTPAECACLISITNNPSIYDPTSTKVFNYEVTEGDVRELDGYGRNKVRKENVLWVMRNEGYLTEEEYQEALAQELVFKRGIDPEDKIAQCQNEACMYRNQVKNFVVKSDGLYYCPNCGNKTEIGVDASQEVYSWFVDTVLEDIAYILGQRDGLDWSSMNKKTYDEYMSMYKEAISGAGYHIYTTLDMTVQNQVDKIYTNLSEIPADKSIQQLQSGMVVIDNQTGDIVAMAGGVGEKNVHDAYNRATDAKLQPGSSIKPLTVYGPAFEQGMINPATVIMDMPRYYTGTRPFPYNDNRRYNYSRTIYDSIVRSVNAVAVNTLDKLGFGYSYNFAKEKFKLSYLTDDYTNSAGTHFTDLDYSPLAMGAPTVGVTIRQMANAYSSFANNGVYRDARTFTKVYNSKGELIVDNPQTSQTILSEKTVQYMNYCLYNAVQGGTGTAAKISGQAICGKTGTTSSLKDRWFCGFSDYYTAAVWCGYDNPEVISLVGNTSNPACRLFKKVMEPLHAGKQKVEMYDKSKFEQISVCLDCGNLATDACTLDARGFSRVEKVMVYTEDIPKEKCTCHVLMDFCETCDAVATEYCKNFAAVGQCKLTPKALVKMTKAQVEEIAAASGKGLEAKYVVDHFIWLVDKNGKDVNEYKGIKGDKNANVSAPYLICSKHTKEAWEAYIGSVTPPTPTDPTTPTEPETPTDPTTPTEPDVPAPVDTTEPTTPPVTP